MITRQNPSIIRYSLEAAVDFWFAGYRNAYYTIFRFGQVASPPLKKETRKVALEVLWASFLWLSYLIIFHPKEITNFSSSFLKRLSLSANFWPIIVMIASVACFILGSLTKRKSEPCTINSQEAIIPIIKSVNDNQINGAKTEK